MNQPFDIAGIFWADDAALYRIDGNVNKPIYRHILQPSASEELNDVVRASGSGW